MDYKDCKLVATVQNAGGSGKSTLTEAYYALGALAGLNPLVFDADPGMRGFRNRSGGQGLIELGWDTMHEAGQDGMTWCEKHFADRKLVLIDTGANFFSATHRVKGYFFEVIEAALRLGVHVALHVVVGTNKAGSFRGAINFHNEVGRHVDVILVRNNLDGSSEFGEGKLSANWAATIDIDHLSPGLQAYRLTRAEPLLSVVREPTPGFQMASALIAQWLLQIAEVEHVHAIFGGGVTRELEELSALAPKSFNYRLTSLDCVTDENLSANVSVSRAWDQFLDASPEADRTRFIAAAKELWRAERAFLGQPT